MSLLAKSNPTDSQIATKTTRGAAKRILKTQPIPTDEHPTRSDTTLKDVAITLADAQTNEAMQAYNARTAENLGRFASFAKNTQETVASAWIAQILGEFEVNEGDLYEPTQE